MIPTNNRFESLPDNKEDNGTEDRKENNFFVCQGCSFMFKNKSTLEDHKRSAHGPKLTNFYNEEDKDKAIKDLKQQLLIEKKANRQKSQEYDILEKEYRACEAVVSVIQEESERLKINNKDLRATVQLTQSNTTVISQNTTEAEYMCKECGYPFRTKIQLDIHMKKHEHVTKEMRPPEQKCHLCKQIFSSVKEFEKHVQLEHVQYNCQECSFQAGTKMVLSKHINLSHKGKNDTPEDTLKCGECSEQF